MGYYRNKNKGRKAIPQAAKPAEDRRLVVKDNGPGEDPYIYALDLTHPWNQAELKAGKFRLFDPAVDDRGPEVPVTLTYGLREGTWFPQTEGSYLIAFMEPDPAKRPASVANFRLHFGSVSSPQPTKAIIHRLYLDLVAKHPELVGHLKVVKMPCVFCRDSALAPGGSSVPIPLDSLPPPAPASQVTKFYM